MKRKPVEFTVLVARDVRQYATVSVVAMSEEDAERDALAMDQSEIAWQDTEIIEVRT